MDFDSKLVEGFKEILQSVKVDKIMHKEVHSVYVMAEFSEVEEKFVDNSVNHLPVIDDDKRLVGIITQKYLYKAQSPRKFIDGEIAYRPDIIIDGDSYYNKETLDSFILDKVMKRNPTSLVSDNSIFDAIKLMADRNLGFLPIVNDDERVVGVISTNDLLQFTSKVLSLSK